MKTSFPFDITDPKVISGIIYMADPENIGSVVEIVRQSLSQNYNESVYVYLVETVSYYCRSLPFDVLTRIFEATSEKNEDFVRQIINEPSVVDSIRSVRHCQLPRYTYDYNVIAPKIQKLLTKENALKILKSEIPDPLFGVLGYHPVIAEDIELQIKWIFIIAERKGHPVKSVPWYVTDQALERASSMSLETTIRFIQAFLFGCTDLSRRKALFSPETLRKIVTNYLAVCNVPIGKAMLNKIKEYETNFSNNY